MAPKKPNSSSKDPKSISASFKQSKLDFTVAKRSGSAGKAKGKKQAPRSASLSKPASPVISLTSDSDDDLSDDGGQHVVAGVSRKKSQRGGGPALKRPRLQEDDDESASDGLELFEDAESDAEIAPRPPTPQPKERLDVQDKAGKWRKHYGVVRNIMGNIAPVHGEGQTSIDHILRVFDLAYEYGPCIGVTRMQRWERADALGLNPPIEVKEILSTKEGSEDNRYVQCVFYDEL